MGRPNQITDMHSRIFKLEHCCTTLLHSVLEKPEILLHLSLGCVFPCAMLQSRLVLCSKKLCAKVGFQGLFRVRGCCLAVDCHLLYGNATFQPCMCTLLLTRLHSFRSRPMKNGLVVQSSFAYVTLCDPKKCPCFGQNLPLKWCHCIAALKGKVTLNSENLKIFGVHEKSYSIGLSRGTGDVIVLQSKWGSLKKMNECSDIERGEKW